MHVCKLQFNKCGDQQLFRTSITASKKVFFIPLKFDICQYKAKSFLFTLNFELLLSNLSDFYDTFKGKKAKFWSLRLLSVWLRNCCKFILYVMDFLLFWQFFKHLLFFKMYNDFGFSIVKKPFELYNNDMSFDAILKIADFF